MYIRGLATGLTALVAPIFVAASVIPLGHEVAEIPASDASNITGISAAVEGLEKRDNAMFSIGYALCGYGYIDPAGGAPSGGSREDMFFWGGQQELGCVEHDKSSIYNWGANGRTYAFGSQVCGVNINFYLQNGNYDFYRDHGDGTLLGTCYPHGGGDHYCLDWSGSCVVSAKWFCYYSGNGGRIC